MSLLLLLASCTKDHPDSVDSERALSSPDCAFTSPETNASEEEGVVVVFAGTVEDEFTPAGELSLSLSSDLDGDLGAVQSDEAGGWELQTDLLSVGTHALVFQAIDQDGLDCSAEIVFTVGNPPAVLILLPEPDSVLGDLLPTSFEAEILDDVDAPEALTVSWEHDTLGVLDTSSSDSAGLLSFDLDDLEVGEHHVTLTVTDSEGFYAQAEVDFSVDGSPGEATVALLPEAPTSADDLEVTVLAEAVDPEGEPVTYAYAWSVGGVDLSLSESTVPASLTARGELWTVTVTPSDAWSEGPSSQVTAAIGNAPPSVAAVTIAPDPLVAGDTVTCSYSGFHDEDGDADSSTIQWSKNGTDANTGSTFTNTQVVGDVLACSVTPNDGTEDGLAVSASVTVSNTLPVLASATLTPDPAYEDDTLVCTPSTATDADGETPTLSYAWSVGGADPGVSGATLDGDDFDRDQDVTCTVTPSDATGSGTPAVSNTVTISNSAPSAPSGLSIAPTDPTVDDDLVCSFSAAGDDEDDDSLTYDFVWTVDSATHSGAVSTTTWAGDTVPSSELSADEQWQCFVQAYDGTDYSSQASSSAVTIAPDEVVYDIVLADLDNQGSSCSSTTYDAVYNGCSGDWGFSWTDTAAVAPSSVTVELYHGIMCGSSTSKSPELNGVTAGSFSLTGGNCNCNPSESVNTWVLTDISGYSVGGTNVFSIDDGGSCEGLSINSSWGAGVYARVTVEY